MLYIVAFMLGFEFLLQFSQYPIDIIVYVIIKKNLGNFLKNEQPIFKEVNMKSKSSIYIFWLSLSIIFIIACSASGPIFTSLYEIPNNKSVIYFYREKSLSGAISPFNINVNDKKVIGLKNDGYFPNIADAGVNKIKGNFGIYSFDIDLVERFNNIFTI